MEYFVLVDGKTRGPFTLPQMQTLYRRREIAKETLFWREGMDEWQKIAEIQEQLRSDRKPRRSDNPRPRKKKSRRSKSRQREKRRLKAFFAVIFMLVLMVIVVGLVIAKLGGMF